MIKHLLVTVVIVYWAVLFCIGWNLAAGGVSYDLSVTVFGTTVNAYHYQKGARYNWGIQQWGMDP